MIPSEQQIREDARFLGFTDKDAERLVVHGRRARGESTTRDGFKANHGASGGRVSGIGDPVGEMACDDPALTPEVERQQALLFDMFTQAAASKRAVRNTLERLDGVQAYVKPIGQTSTPCKCEPNGCDQPAEKRGLCLTDYQWTYRWEQEHPGEIAPLVPASVIQERTKRREKAS